MERKSQAEFAVILGLLLIAIIVGVYTFGGLKLPFQQVVLTEEQEAVSDYVKNMVREASYQTLSTLYVNGGYLDTASATLGSVDHRSLGNNIAYWQKCNAFDAPELEEQFRTGVKQYMMANLKDSESVQGISASFQKVSLFVNADFFDDKVTVSINLPTTVAGQGLPQPYTVDIPTKAGRINEFARNFARYQQECRVFDTHLLRSVSQSTWKSTPCWLPTVPSGGERPQTFTWQQLRDCMQRHILTSLSRTILWREVPLDSQGKIAMLAPGYSGIEFNPVPAIIDYTGLPESTNYCLLPPAQFQAMGVKSKAYEDLQVAFYMGDDDGIDRNNFVVNPEPVQIRMRTDGLTPFNFLQGFTSADFNVMYSVSYPVIVDVWDPVLRKSFKFATAVSIAGNSVDSTCAAFSQPTSTPADICTTGADTQATIRVVRTDGQPVENAMVSFYTCGLGLTKDGGYIRTAVPSAVWGGLTVVDGIASDPYSSYTTYTSCMSGSRLSNIVVEIPYKRRFNMIFRTVNIERNTATGAYTITSIVTTSPSDLVDAMMTREGDPCSPPLPVMVLNRNPGYAASVTTSHIPLDAYNVSVSTTDNDKAYGYVTSENYVPPSGDSTGTLYVYAPKLISGGDWDNSYAAAVKQLYGRCGIDSLMTTDLLGSRGTCP